jgi:hypothetical protein
VRGHENCEVVDTSFSTWRANELVFMGFDLSDAWRLAEARSVNGSIVPLHDIRRALRAGCPHELALRIWL